MHPDINFTEVNKKKKDRIEESPQLRINPLYEKKIREKEQGDLRERLSSNRVDTDIVQKMKEHQTILEIAKDKLSGPAPTVDVATAKQLQNMLNMVLEQTNKLQSQLPRSVWDRIAPPEHVECSSPKNTQEDPLLKGRFVQETGSQDIWITTANKKFAGNEEAAPFYKKYNNVPLLEPNLIVPVCHPIDTKSTEQLHEQDLHKPQNTGNNWNRNKVFEKPRWTENNARKPMTLMNKQMQPMKARVSPPKRLSPKRQIFSQPLRKNSPPRRNISPSPVRPPSPFRPRDTRQFSPPRRLPSPQRLQMSSQRRPVSPIRMHMSPVRRQMSPLSSVRRQPSPSSMTRRQISPLSSMRRQPSPPIAMRRQMSPSAVMRRQVSPSIGMRRQTSSPASMRRQISPPASMRRQISPPALMRRQMSPSTSMRRQISPPNSMRRQISPPPEMRRQISPPPEMRRQMSPPRRMTSPSRREIMPSRRQMMPQENERHDNSPLRRMSPPRRQLSPPIHQMSPPRRFADEWDIPSRGAIEQNTWMRSDDRVSDNTWRDSRQNKNNTSWEQQSSNNDRFRKPINQDKWDIKEGSREGIWRSGGGDIWTNKQSTSSGNSGNIGAKEPWSQGSSSKWPDMSTSGGVSSDNWSIRGKEGFTSNREDIWSDKNKLRWELQQSKESWNQADKDDWNDLPEDARDPWGEEGDLGIKDRYIKFDNPNSSSTWTRENDKGDSWQNKSDQWQNKGDQWQNKGDQWQNKGDQWQNKGDQWQDKGNQWQDKGNQWQNKGDQWQSKSDQWQNKSDQWKSKGDQWSSKGDSWHNKGDHWPSKGDSWQNKTQVTNTKSQWQNTSNNQTTSGSRWPSQSDVGKKLPQLSTWQSGSALNTWKPQTFNFSQQRSFNTNQFKDRR